MNIKPGEYYIFEPPYWCKVEYKKIIIVGVDIESYEVAYKYYEQDRIRTRTFDQFLQVKLIPVSPLMEELL